MVSDARVQWKFTTVISMSRSGWLYSTVMTQRTHLESALCKIVSKIPLKLLNSLNHKWSHSWTTKLAKESRLASSIDNEFTPAKPVWQACFCEPSPTFPRWPLCLGWAVFHVWQQMVSGFQVLRMWGALANVHVQQYSKAGKCPSGFLIGDAIFALAFL